MMGKPVLYKRKEVLTIIGYTGNDYIVHNEDTGQVYALDAMYFRKHFEAIDEPIQLDEPIHTEVWKKLEEQGQIIQRLKNRVNSLRNDLRYERQENNKLRKELGMKRKAPYRNGRKRGSHGHKG